MSAYCVLDDDYYISQFRVSGPMDPLKVTAAHEFFHAVQFAYDIGEDGWFMESTATWMEEHVYDQINDNRQYLTTSPLAQPMIPLDQTSGFRVYGAWIFWQFLTEYFGSAAPDPNIVRAVWRKADGSPTGQTCIDAGARIRSGLGPSTGRAGVSDGPSRTSVSGTLARRSSTTKGGRTRRRPCPGR